VRCFILTFFIHFLILHAGFFCITYGQRPIARYTFDNTPKDISGNQNHGNIHGSVTPTMDRFGNHCGAYRFDGSGYIEVPSSSTLETPSRAITITTWYRLAQKRDNQWLTILCKGATNDERPDNPQYRLQVQQNIAPSINTCSGGQATGSSTISLNTAFTECDYVFGDHPLRPFEWGFYALVYDGKSVVAYMNDQKVFEYPYNVPLQRNTAPLYIGLDEPGVIEKFDGALDDLCIYDKALDQQEIARIFHEQRPTDWNLEEYKVTTPVNKQVILPATKCQAVVSFDPPKVTHTGCGKVTVKQVAGPASGSSITSGKHLVVYSIAAESGYTQNQGFYIIVKDVTPPVISVPADTTIFISPGTPHANWPYRQPTATDNCGVQSVQLTKGLPAGSEFIPGKHLIEYTATDLYGNTSAKSFTVTVKEKQQPKNPAAPVAISVPPPVKDKPVRKTVDSIVVKKLPAVKQADSVKPKPMSPKRKPAPNVPADFNKRQSVQQQFLEVNSTRLRLVMYDNAEYDGDTISLYLNGSVVIAHQEVNPKGTEFFIDIDSTIDNELVMYAENLGSIPPNTALMVLHDNDKRYEINLSSSLSKNGLIRIRKKKQGP
jgi:hypothetical protein